MGMIGVGGFVAAGTGPPIDPQDAHQLNFMLGARLQFGDASLAESPPLWGWWWNGNTQRLDEKATRVQARRHFRPRNGTPPCAALRSGAAASKLLSSGMVMDYAGLPARKRVLIVDDSVDVRDVWHDWLTIWGFDVEEAENGEEAVRKAAACPPDLVLMDWTMPVLDGLRATELLKENASTAMVPVLALSADTFSPTPQEALGAGCASFLGKPVTPEILLTEIRRAFRRGTPPPAR
jgi:CheY-like chemotaxis protein